MARNQVLIKFSSSFRITYALKVFFVFIFAILFAVYSGFKEVNLLATLMFLLYFISIIISISIIKKFTFTVFLISFGIFLVFGEFLELYFNYPPFASFPINVLNHTYISVSISLVALLIGALLSKYISLTKTTTFSSDSMSNRVMELVKKNISILRIIIFAIFLLAFVAKLLLTIEHVTAVRENNFLITYLDFKSDYPYIIQKIAEFLPISFYMYLITMPKVKPLLIITGLYFLDRVSYLLLGQRFPFLLFVLFCVTYFILRKELFSKFASVPSIFKKHKLLSVVIVGILSFLLFLAFVFLINAVENKRSLSKSSALNTENIINSENSKGIMSSVNNTLDVVQNVIHQQGYSINVIKYGKLYQDRIQNDRVFTIGRTVDYLRNNQISNKLFDTADDWYHGGNSKEKAQQSGNYQHAISYIVLHNIYLDGRGIGGSFIAENFHDFAYLGIFIFSSILGFLIVLLFNRNNPVALFLGFISFDAIMRTPRDSWDGFLLDWLSVTNIFFILFVILATLVFSLLLSKICKKR